MQPNQLFEIELMSHSLLLGFQIALIVLVGFYDNWQSFNNL